MLTRWPFHPLRIVSIWLPIMRSGHCLMVTCKFISWCRRPMKTRGRLNETAQHVKTNTLHSCGAFIIGLASLTNQFMILHHKSGAIKLKISIGKAETRIIMLSRTAFERSKINLFEISIKHTYYDLYGLNSIKDSVRGLGCWRPGRTRFFRDLYWIQYQKQTVLQHRKLNLSKNLARTVVYTFSEHSG